MEASLEERLVRLGVTELGPKAELSNETLEALRRLVDDLEASRRLVDALEAAKGNEGTEDVPLSRNAPEDMRMLMRSLEKSLDPESFKTVKDEAESILLEVSRSSSGESRTLSNGGSSPDEASASDARGLQTILPPSDAGSHGKSSSNSSPENELRSAMKRLQSELEDEKASNKQLNDELSVAVRQLEVSTSIDGAQYALNDLQYAAEELKETKEKLKAAETVKITLQARLKQLEDEASILNRDVLASDRDTKRAARFIDPTDDSTGLDTSMSISRASKGSAALEEITELEDEGLTRRSAVIEVANLVMQRDLRMAEAEKKELKEQLKRAEDQKNELEDIILSLRQDIALAEINGTEAVAQLEASQTRVASLEADLEAEKRDKEAYRASLSSLTQEHGELEADLRNYRAQLEPLQSVEKDKQRLESECLDLREAEKEQKKMINHLTAALKELDFERSKLREYLIRYETELKRTETRAEQLKQEFLAMEGRRTPARTLADSGRTRRSEKDLMDEQQVAQLTVERDRLRQKDVERDSALKALESTVKVLQREATQSAVSVETLRNKLRKAQDENVQLRLSNELRRTPAPYRSMLEATSKRTQHIRS
ncbi:hypothetical protein NDN08_000046 [Rhodosorus marinus]|uniref:Centrosomal protein of 162 kDa n=1 Tax=Rhodosorus marinus TaxID=101924 RepID=A0AAV8UE23_9RHOD|nr:hypothetical protein NDN08_000046 [Rhodosorus marinus]